MSHLTELFQLCIFFESSAPRAGCWGSALCSPSIQPGCRIAAQATLWAPCEGEPHVSATDKGARQVCNLSMAFLGGEYIVYRFPGTRAQRGLLKSASGILQSLLEWDNLVPIFCGTVIYRHSLTLDWKRTLVMHLQGWNGTLGTTTPQMCATIVQLEARFQVLVEGLNGKKIPMFTWKVLRQSLGIINK